MSVEEKMKNFLIQNSKLKIHNSLIPITYYPLMLVVGVKFLEHIRVNAHIFSVGS